jgi:hypothetical protein
VNELNSVIITFSVLTLSLWTVFSSLNWIIVSQNFKRCRNPLPLWYAMAQILELFTNFIQKYFRPHLVAIVLRVGNVSFCLSKIAPQLCCSLTFENFPTKMALDLRPLRTFSSEESSEHGGGDKHDAKRCSFTPRVDHQLVTMYQPYPERTQYDSLLMQWADNGFNWQKFKPQHKNCGMFSFPILRCSQHTDSEDENFADAKFATIEVSVGGRNEEESNVVNQSRLKRLFGKKKRNAGTPKEDKYVVVKIQTHQGKHLLARDLSKVTAIPNGSDEIEMSVSQTVKSPDAKRRSMLAKKEKKEFPLEIVDENSRLQLVFANLESKNEFLLLAQALSASLIPESAFGVESKFLIPDPKSVVTRFSLCIHQARARMGNVEKKDFVLDGAFLYDREVHLMLFPGRLIISEGGQVVNIIELLPGKVNFAIPKTVVNSVMGQSSFTLDASERNQVFKGRYVFEVPSEVERDRWIHALKIATSESPLKTPVEAEESKTIDITHNQTLLDQKMFFELVRFSMHTLNAIITTELPTRAEWEAELKQTEKDHSLEALNSTYLAYLVLLHRVWRLLRAGYLLCEDGIGYRGDENIAFSYPGFDTEMFNVATLSMVRIWKLFRAAGKNHSYSLSGWDGTLGARSIGKELMQTLPEVNELYEEGKSAEAKAIWSEAIMEQLHNLVLTNYLRTHKQVFGDSFTMKDALQAKNFSAKTVAIMSEIEVQYFVNPSIEMLKDYLCGKDRRIWNGDDEEDTEHESRTHQFHGNGVMAASNHVRKEAIVWTQLNWLQAMRVIHQERMNMLQDLEAQLAAWFVDIGVTSDSKLVKFFTRVQSAVQEEKKSMEQVLDRLPTHEKLTSRYEVYSEACKATTR